MRTNAKWATLLLFIASLVGAMLPAYAQATPPVTAGTGDILHRITAESAPYKLEWDGKQGVFVRAAFGQEPEQRWPLVYLHTDPGPKGYSRYLAWFLARDKNDFALLWCYLNDSGREFWCWLYRFSANQLTTLRFTGDYAFTPPDKSQPVPALNQFALTVVPPYTGPDFSFRDWTRRAGKIDSLDIKPAADNKSPDAMARTLTGLQVQPLHDLKVPTGNGWRDNGWRELHALAYDPGKTPYYLILYSNSSRGFVLDLKNALTYVADFGGTVTFGPDATRFGKAEDLTIEPVEIRARRYEPFEVTLPSLQEHDNPFTNVLIDADVRSPDGKRMVVPGFWDGGKTWRIRFTPTRTGTWTWRLRSNDPDLHGQEGTVECIADTQTVGGFLRVNPSLSYRHHFLKGDSAPFFPSFVQDPIHWEPKPGGGTKLASQTNEQPPVSDVEVPASYLAFQKRVDACAALGINRFVGGYIFDPDAFTAGKQSNEGGVPFLNNDPERPNPAYFQWMDRRIAYCNERGIVPDIGLGSAQKLFATFSDDQLRRIWRYLLARYAAYHVCWNLFRTDGEPLTPDVESHIALFGGLTRLYDPHVHVVTAVIAGYAPAPPVDAKPAPEPAESEKPAPEKSAAGQIEKPVPGVPEANPNPAPGPVGGGRQNRFGFSRNRGNNRTPDGNAPPNTGNESSRRRPVPPVAAPPPPPAALSAETWMDVISLAGGDLNGVWWNWQVEKPVVVVDAPSSDAETARRRMWETRMRGGFWAGSSTFHPDGTSALESPETQMAAACARFFQKTRFWRLTPHQEFLGGPQEDPNLRRRRKKLEADALRQRPGPGGTRDTIPQEPPPPDGPVYMLADPAWEYVVYFTKGGGVMLDLLEATGRLRMAWFNPRTGQFSTDEMTMGGQYKVFTAPDNNDWVLYLSRR